MSSLIANSLYEKQAKRFGELSDLSKQFSATYCGNSIIRDNIFAVIENYARKKEVNLELFRYPIEDEELWAMTFLKKGTIFVYINSKLELCKQFFAAAHELYHIYRYVEDEGQSYIKNGSIMDSGTANEVDVTQEDLEANAFAGLLLMPDTYMKEQAALFGIDSREFDVDAVLTLMEMFAIPYKAVVLRLHECCFLTRKKVEELLLIDSAEIADRITLTGKAKRWQLDGRGTESFGTLFEKVEYNVRHEYLTKKREEEDKTYISELKKKFDLE